MSDIVEKMRKAVMRSGACLWNDALYGGIDEIERLRARVAELESRLAEIEAQEPAFWYVPADDEDGEDALLNSCRDGTCPAVGAIPLYTRHAATQPRSR